MSVPHTQQAGYRPSNFHRINQIIPIPQVSVEIPSDHEIPFQVSKAIPIAKQKPHFTNPKALTSIFQLQQNPKEYASMMINEMKSYLSFIDSTDWMYLESSHNTDQHSIE